LSHATAQTTQLVQELEQALDVQKQEKARGMQLVFAKFDSKRSLWAAAATSTAILDALGSLAQASSKPGYTRPKILECPLDASPCIHVVQGRHPCVEVTHSGGEFIPNDLTLGSQDGDSENAKRVLLLSGPNMVSRESELSVE
jgi:DNA mismatch repair protein MSH6